MSKLYYLGKPADGFGWGVANTNLVAALRKHCEVVVCEDQSRKEFDAPVFVPITDANLVPLRKIKSAPKVMGYCFTEWPIGRDARRNARLYDVIFCGSSWNAKRLADAGIRNTDILLQGVDHSIFNPRPVSARKGFVVFSGGKYEFRKGQDIVLRAMRHFMNHRTDVVLLAAWHNPWPHTMQSMQKSWLIDAQKPFENMPQDRVFMIPAIPNKNMAAIYEQSHIGLFPNRCEAGNNMVMCEYMACGRTVIATNAHGHEDVLNSGCYRLNPGSEDAAGWSNPNVSDVIAHLEHAYLHQDRLRSMGEVAANFVREKLSWSACAENVLAAAQLPALDRVSQSLVHA